ncbi:lipoxygenase homology domain-containing protein 1-like [Tubulanus polymorphus]|uniref:lipoxygenase homology domain-containing protein 1-like n=1 Tax=Tubulanus polymorphus TaxID=672921 RepID=UPI003DA299EB
MQSNYPVTYTNSEGMKWAMQQTTITSFKADKAHNPHPPFAAKYGRKIRPTSAPAAGRSEPWHQVNYNAPQPRKRCHISLNHQNLESKVSRHAPYAARKYDSAVFTSNVARPMSSLPDYNPLHDPHLQDYYEKRFARALLSAQQKQTLRRRASSIISAAGGADAGKKGKQKIALYKVAVTTGDRKAAGTDARVFIQLKGTKNRMPKIRLFKKTTASKDPRKDPFKFARGTTHIFKVKANELGELKSCVIEHDGLEKKHSWFLESVEVVNVTTGTSWMFLCQQWLSLHEADCQLSRELFAKKSIKTEYEVTVVTGDGIGAGTDANVFLSIFGKSGVLSKVHLKTAARKPFQRSQSDIFSLKGNCLGPLHKIRIQHDNTGIGPGWFLDRVVITDLKHPKWKYFFPCNQWLSRTEGDRAISRDLIGSQDPLASRRASKYMVTVYTGTVRGAGTDANVILQMFGSLGDSGEIKLNNSKNNFEKGQKDEFTVSCPHIGKLDRIRIGHDNKGPAPGWFLDKIIVDDMEMSKVYEFPCNRWFSRTEDDGRIQRDLIPGVGTDDAPAGVPYRITVTTGDKPLAGTSAQVFIIMYGGKSGEETSGKIWLDTGKFERGKTDIFNVEVAKVLSPLSRIDMGHDNSGPGAGWFLESVVVKCASIGMEQTFDCHKWLSLDNDDGLIERTLYETKSLRKTGKKATTWFAWVVTSDVRSAGTDANVSIVLYGDKGKSDVIPITSKGDGFERGQTDKVKVESSEVGIPYKLRVQHDNSGQYAGWHLDKVSVFSRVIELENMSTQKRYTFKCGKWLAYDEDGHTIVREMPAEGAGIKKPLKLKNYEVEVYTGDKKHAGTDAHVFLNLFGEQGDTGERPLKHSLENQNKFERGKTDKFLIEAVDLKQLTKIRVGHDGKRPGAGWYLDKIVVKDPDKPKQEYLFECNRWLAFDEDDGLIVREITISGSQHLESTSYHVKVRTGDVRNAGTDAKVWMILFGSGGDTGRLWLRRSDNTYNKFERGRTDLFTLEATDIGTIERMQIGHDGTLAGAGWFLDEVLVDVPSRGEYYRFAAHRWLDKTEGDGLTEIELEPADVRKGERFLPYEVTVWTGTKRGAGTDANVFIQMYGENGKTEEYKLRNRTDNFESGQVDKFKIEAADIGHLIKMRVGHDGKGAFAGWYLEKILVQRTAISKRVSSARGSKKKRSALARRTNVNLSDDEESVASSQRCEGDLEEYWFVANRWFAKGEDDGKIVRELLPTTPDGRQLNVGLEELEYVIKLKTGDKYGAGTDANVYINITGDKGDTGERQLKQSNNVNKFERNMEDIFHLKLVELGRLRKLKIRHDNAGGGGAWYLDYIEITDPKSKEVYFFPCQRWLAIGEDDGQISRELVPVDAALKAKLQQKDKKAVRNEIALETKAAMQTYHVYVTTGDKWGAGTDANVFIYLFGELDTTGQVFLKSSKTYNNKFERNHTDEFIIEAVDIGDLQKIKIGHDDYGGGADWFLDKVEIDCPALGKKWVFPCGRWLGRGEDDGLLERELFPQELATEEYTPCIPYEITTYTSDMGSASTDADVFVVLYGVDTCTEQKSLCSSKQERKKCFRRGQKDKFVVELEDVGDKIEKLRIGHDGTGFGAGWHLNKVEIRKLKEDVHINEMPDFSDDEASTSYVFPCNRWLSRSDEDGEIVRELIPQSVFEEKALKDGTIKKKEMKRDASLEKKIYTVSVYTGDVKRGGTDANVFMIMYGDKGDSGERKLLKSETHRDKFERAQMDRFAVEAVDLGKLYKIKIRHDNSMPSPAWFLDRVEILDPSDQENHIFHCERWLAKNIDDGKLERTLYVKGYDGEMSSTSTIRSSRIGSMSSMDSMRTHEPFAKSPRMRRHSTIQEEPEGPTVPYTVRVTTGDGQDCGTDSRAWIKIIGPKGKHSGKLSLDLAQKQRFEPGSTDLFSIEATDVDEVKKIQVGHDGEKPGSGWFVKDIEIDMPTKGKHYTFNCRTWLAKDKGDGKTEKMFSVNDGQSVVTSYKPLVPYECTVFTGDVAKAGTDGEIFIKVFGENGSTDDTKLDKSGDRFERAKVDHLKLELEDVGALKKLRVWLNEKGSRNDWNLEKIMLRNMNTGDLTTFECHNWLSKNLGDGKLSRDLPAMVRGKSQVAKTSYRVNVKTSDVSGAGTDANVFVVIFGANGDSGELHLKTSETFKDPFENNQLDVFTFKDVLSLGELAKLRVWHDNKGFGAAWHLNYIEVVDLRTDKKYMFPCDRWLSKSDDDKQTIRELTCVTKPTDSPKRAKMSYEISISTSDKRDAGMIHNAWIILVGEKSSSKELIFENSAKNKILRKGQTDSMKFVTKNLGKLEKCIVGAVEREDRPIGGPGDRDSLWHCHEIIVTDLSTGDKFVFPCKNWIGIESEINKKQGMTLELKKVEQSIVSATRQLASVKYEVIVHTGNKFGCGTNANVFITIYGSNGDSGRRPLTQKFRDLFERNQTDRFQLEMLDLGDIVKAKIEHDNSGFSPGWYLDHVEIINMGTNKTWTLPCEKWFDKKQGDGEICRELFPRD